MRRELLRRLAMASWRATSTAVVRHRCGDHKDDASCCHVHQATTGWVNLTRRIKRGLWKRGMARLMMVRLNGSARHHGICGGRRARRSTTAAARAADGVARRAAAAAASEKGGGDGGGTALDDDDCSSA